MTKQHASEDFLVGAHCSTAGGVFNALIEGKSIGATTIQMFTANQRQWKSRPVEPELAAKWRDTLKEIGLREVMSHDSYLINLGACDQEILAKSRIAFAQEIERCHALDLTYLNFHPGAATKESREQCLDRIIESLLELEPLVAKGKTRLLFEMTAGQGSAVGYTFEDISYLIEGTKDKMPVGVCIDTCHIFVAGYDIRTAEACDMTLREFDRIVGLKWLYAFHVNDSKKGLGTRVDRHERLGEGTIGIECFKFLMSDPRTRALPKYLETPRDLVAWEKEIRMLKEFGALTK